MSFNKHNLSQRKLDGYLKYCEIIQWGRKNPVKFVEYFMGIEFLDLQKYVFMNMWSTPFVLLCQCRNSGKALSLDTIIPTPNGEIAMKDIKVGDYVFDEKGKSTRVKFTSEIFQNHDCYKVIFDDGEEIIADSDHLWQVEVNGEIRVISTNEMANSCYNFRVPMQGELEYEEKELPINPYDLGFNLGNKNSNIDKRIPNIYLHSSISQRQELLKGLMDSKGKCNKNGKCKFTQKDYDFTMQISKLLSSLGIKHNIEEKYKSHSKTKKSKSYVVGFFVGKNEGYKDIISVKKVASVPTKCIGVENPNHLYLCGNRYTVTHNSTISAPFLMAKSVLYPNFYSYIISTNGSQAQETFLKIEKITKQQISSFVGLTDFFKNEIVTSNANKDGFTHKPESFTFELFNGSKVHTLNSNYDGTRGKRSNCNFYDETGFMLEKAFSATEPFTTQDANFKLGGDVNVSLEPKAFPNQLIYASSASSIDTYFYSKYKEFSKQMMLGNKNYFVADINCELVLNPMFNGKLYPVSLLTQEKIDNAMRENKEQALREYMNIFSKEGGEQQPFKRGRIIVNSYTRKPMLCNEGNVKRHIVAFYDPARQHDNSIVLFAEFFKTEETGWMCDIINCVSLVDIGTKKKIPMRTPEQADYIKNLLIDYNGTGFSEYENIGAFLVDSGAGGGGVSIADYFMEEWTDKKGSKHKGLIDKTESSEYVSKFPNAIDKLRLISPKKYRNEMFDALVEMLDQDLISFTEAYDGKGYLMIPYETTIDILDPDTKKNQKEIKYQRVNLSFEEELALRNIDLLKEELVQIHRFDNADRTNHKYALSPDKQNTMHDDRAYCMAMCGWYLKQLRRENIKNRQTLDIYENSQLVFY